MLKNQNPNPLQEKNVKEYFEEIAMTFDSYYKLEAETGGLIGKLAHIVFRKPAMACRYQATFHLLGKLPGKHVLDVGCGSGIYSLEIVKRGGSATGLDISSAMIDLANQNAQKLEIKDRCRFVLQDLKDFEPGVQAFHACIAIGFFDYIAPAQQAEVFARLLQLAKQDVIITFPKKWVPATFFRKIFFLKKKLDVYFFTKPEVMKLVGPGIQETTFYDCGSVWTVRFRKSL
ncbi:MAG: methyltransferase domain-containing protein [Candidatus Aminicenantes bacterium]|nr:methyltransferase domain-containing protein [Candidatus Aminicenantes bacterium]